MFGWQKIKGFLRPDSWLTTAEVAEEAKLSVGHIRRVLNWNLEHEVWLRTDGGKPVRWAKR